MIEALARLLHAGFGLVIASLLPLFAIAAVAVVVVGLLGGALGIRDGALGHIVRTLAILLALGLVAERTATAIVAFAVHSWTGLAGESDFGGRGPETGLDGESDFGGRGPETGLDGSEPAGDEW